MKRKVTKKPTKQPNEPVLTTLEKVQKAIAERQWVCESVELKQGRMSVVGTQVGVCFDPTLPNHILQRVYVLQVGPTVGIHGFLHTTYAVLCEGRNMWEYVQGFRHTPYSVLTQLGIPVHKISDEAPLEQSWNKAVCAALATMSMVRVSDITKDVIVNRDTYETFRKAAHGTTCGRCSFKARLKTRRRKG